MQRRRKTPILDDLYQELEGMSRMRQHVILFALFCDLLPSDVIWLEWHELKEIDLPWRARKLLERVPRHFQSSFVFWEYDVDNTVLPIFSIDLHFALATQKTWPEFVVAYRNAQPICLQEDRVFFTRCLDGVFVAPMLAK
jgi:hypothetical protein